MHPETLTTITRSAEKEDGREGNFSPEKIQASLAQF